jgi:hypothetical protein
MTANEFNNKYKNYIVHGFEGLEFDIPECTEYLDNKIQDLINEYPFFELKQIKVKFNWYCFYSNIPVEIENEITQELNKINPL